MISEGDALFANDLVDVFEINGHKVTLTHNGTDAISHLKTTNFDLVITNLFKSNGKNGFHLIGELLRMSKRKPLIIATTAKRRQKDKTEEMNYFLKQVEGLGVSATLEKPFDPAELLVIADKLWAKLD